MDCRVVVEAAVPVYDVETADEAVRIAISKTGEMLNPDLSYVEIDTGSRASPAGEELPPAFVAADEALVALELRMDVFNVDRGEHASRVARKEIGKRLQNIPLKVLSVTEIDPAESDRAGDDSAPRSAEERGRSARAADRIERYRWRYAGDRRTAAALSAFGVVGEERREIDVSVGRRGQRLRLGRLHRLGDSLGQLENGRFVVGLRLVNRCRFDAQFLVGFEINVVVPELALFSYLREETVKMDELLLLHEYQPFATGGLYYYLE